MAPRRWTLRHLMDGVETGMTTMAGMLSAWPERATPWAWFPGGCQCNRGLFIDQGRTGGARDDALFLFFVGQTGHHVVGAADLE